MAIFTTTACRILLGIGLDCFAHNPDSVLDILAAGTELHV